MVVLCFVSLFFFVFVFVSAFFFFFFWGGGGQKNAVRGRDPLFFCFMQFLLFKYSHPVSVYQLFSSFVFIKAVT